MKNLDLPNGFQFTAGDSIHTNNSNHPNADRMPHLSGTLNGSTTHIPYQGQTTLGMYDRSLPGHRLNDVRDLHQSYPDTFNKSGF